MEEETRVLDFESRNRLLTEIDNSRVVSEMYPSKAELLAEMADRFAEGDFDSDLTQRLEVVDEAQKRMARNEMLLYVDHLRRLEEDNRKISEKTIGRLALQAAIDPAKAARIRIFGLDDPLDDLAKENPELINTILDPRHSLVNFHHKKKEKPFTIESLSNEKDLYGTGGGGHIIEYPSQINSFEKPYTASDHRTRDLFPSTIEPFAGKPEHDPFGPIKPFKFADADPDPGKIYSLKHESVLHPSELPVTPDPLPGFSLPEVLARLRADDTGDKTPPPTEK